MLLAVWFCRFFNGGSAAFSQRRRWAFRLETLAGEWFCIKTPAGAFSGVAAIRAPVSLPSMLPFIGCNHDGNLVDSASSHTLVSKIKPCMSKYKRFIL